LLLRVYQLSSNKWFADVNNSQHSDDKVQ
jgi:hypothetical protein